MRKFVKFTKDHVAGFKKGDIRLVLTTTADRLTKEGYCVESTEEAYLKFKEKLSKNKGGNEEYETMKKETNIQNECKGCGGKKDEEGECVDCKEEAEQVEKKYHILTQEDIDANIEYAEGLEVGDEVELDEAGDLVVGEDNKLVKKK